MVLPSVSVIVPTHNEGQRLHETVTGLLATLPTLAEIIVVDDWSTDGSATALIAGHPAVRVHRPEQRLGPSRARNRGAALSRGELLVFSDAHMQVFPGWADQFVAALANPSVGMVGPAVGDVRDPAAIGYGVRFDASTLDAEWLEPAPQRCTAVPGLGGCFIALRRATFFEVGGFDEGLKEWGYEDTELSIRLWLLGYEIYVDRGVDVRHFFRDQFPYEVDHTGILANRLRVAFTHFEGARLAKILANARNEPGFARALAQVSNSDVWSRRDWLRSIRRYNADWYLSRFASRAEPARAGASG